MFAVTCVSNTCSLVFIRPHVLSLFRELLKDRLTETVAEMKRHEGKIKRSV